MSDCLPYSVKYHHEHWPAHAGRSLAVGVRTSLAPLLYGVAQLCAPPAAASLGAEQPAPAGKQGIHLSHYFSS